MGQFPGGVVQFAQVAGNLPEEVLQDIMVNAQIMGEAAEQGALPHGEMPGGLPGDNFVLLDFVGDVNAEGDPALAEGTPVANEADPAPEENVEEDEEDEDEDIEEVGIMSLLLWSVLKHVRLRRSQFVSCVILSAVSGVVLTLERTVRRKKGRNRIEKPSWTVWIEEGDVAENICCNVCTKYT
jgi:hypothetical protein